MKRVRVAPGKYVAISDALAKKAERVFACSSLSQSPGRPKLISEPRRIQSCAMLGPGPTKASRACLTGRARVAAKVRRLLAESGAPVQMPSFDVDAWVGDWLRQPLAELGDRTPAEALRSANGWPLVERLLERMRGGLGS